jgi:hypothetical protein
MYKHNRVPYLLTAHDDTPDQPHIMITECSINTEMNNFIISCHIMIILQVTGNYQY